jgi:SAP domain-containing protein
MTREELNKLRVVDLKKYLDEYDLPKKGKKADLIDRLLDYFESHNGVEEGDKYLTVEESADIKVESADRLEESEAKRRRVEEDKSEQPAAPVEKTETIDEVLHMMRLALIIMEVESILSLLLPSLRMTNTTSTLYFLLLSRAPVSSGCSRGCPCEGRLFLRRGHGSRE